MVNRPALISSPLHQWMNHSQSQCYWALFTLKSYQNSITHTVCRMCLFWSNSNSWYSTVILCVTQKNPLTRVRIACVEAGQVLGHSKVFLWIYSCQRSVRCTVSSNARPHKSQAINIYVQLYWGNNKNIFPCRTVCKNNL